MSVIQDDTLGPTVQGDIGVIWNVKVRNIRIMERTKCFKNYT